MKETGIVMTGDHPAKILAGTKTMTRRVIVPQPRLDYTSGDSNWRYLHKGMTYAYREEWLQFCPYGQVGDRLWVRETWCESEWIIDRVYYKASHFIPSGYKWKSSRFMFKKYARIWLEITEVRVERVQGISPPDILSEGYEPFGIPSGVVWFQELWDSLNAKRGSWDDNPWVWVISFRRLDG